MGNDCIFCQIASGLHPADVVYESGTVLAFRDIHPQAPTHVLIIPRKHIARIADLEPAGRPADCPVFPTIVLRFLYSAG
jgi:histidine triad (HIT) family protein